MLAVSNLFSVATGNEPASVQHGTVSVVHAAGGPARHLRDALPRAGLRAGHDDQQSRRRRRRPGDPPRRAGRHARQGTAQLAEQHLAELRHPDRRSCGRRWRRSARASSWPRPEPADEEAARPATLAALGIMLVPDVLERTPAFVDQVRPGSPAARAGLLPDDLVLLVRQPPDPVLQGAAEGAGNDRSRRPGEAHRAPRAGAGRELTLPGGGDRDVRLDCGIRSLRAAQGFAEDENSCEVPIDLAVLGLGRGLPCRLPRRAARADDDLEALEQKAVAAAVERVAPSVVRIETVGGLERVEKVLFGTGPTTGLVVDPQGYIVSSAFNFVNKPASILVRLPDGTPQAGPAGGHRSQPQDRAAEDRGRSAAAGARGVPAGARCASASGASPWAGPSRTTRPNLSVGILSAVGRIWGKALQTDAAVSPNNYGGPLVDIRGRVLGVLVPLSPQSAEEIAGSSGTTRASASPSRWSTSARCCRGSARARTCYAGVAGVHHAVAESLHRRHGDRLLPAQLARRQGRLQAGRPDRRDRRPQGLPRRPRSSRRSAAATPARSSTSSSCAARSGSSATWSWRPTSSRSSTRFWASCPAAAAAPAGGRQGGRRRPLRLSRKARRPRPRSSRAT